MYCPKRLNAKVEPESINSGKKKKGKNVILIWTSAICSPILLYTLNINIIPIAVSIIANNIIETFEGINLNVKKSMVAFARSSAGLKPGKNFNEPNHK